MRRERPAAAGVLPAFAAGGVELVHAAVAVAGNEGVAVGEPYGAIGIGDGLLPVNLARHVDLLHLADAAQRDEVVAVAQAFDRAPGEACTDFRLGDELARLIDLADFTAGVDPD